MYYPDKDRYRRAITVMDLADGHVWHIEKLADKARCIYNPAPARQQRLARSLHRQGLQTLFASGAVMADPA